VRSRRPDTYERAAHPDHQAAAKANAHGNARDEESRQKIVGEIKSRKMTKPTPGTNTPVNCTRAYLGIPWNNEQNKTAFPGWHWMRVTVWDAQDPTAFWVEANGATGPGLKPECSNHYMCQVIVKNGKIVLFREFQAPLKLTK
jgi:hypothetical protein